MAFQKVEHLLSSPWGILSLSSTVCGSSMASSCYPGRCISDNRMTFCVKSTSAPKGLKACHAPRFCCILRPFFREKCPSGILLEYIKININCYHIFIYIFVCFMSFHLLLCTYDLLQSSITLYWCFIKKFKLIIKNHDGWKSFHSVHCVVVYSERNWNAMFKLFGFFIL